MKEIVTNFHNDALGSFRNYKKLAERAIEQVQIADVHETEKRLDRSPRCFGDLFSTFQGQGNDVWDRQGLAGTRDVLKQRRDRVVAAGGLADGALRAVVRIEAVN